MNKKISILFAAIAVAVVFALAVPMASADPTYPSSTDETEQTRFTPSARSDEALGGNITNMTLSGDAPTSKWHGYYGNVTGEIVLQSTVGNALISWDWNASDGGEVLLTTNSTPSWASSFVAATKANIDSAWSFDTGDSDSATSTFTDAQETVTIAGTDVPITARAYTYNATEGQEIWTTLVVGGFGGTNKTNYLFAGILNAGNETYNGGTADYQMIVPTPEDGTTDTYYFYLELA